MSIDCNVESDGILAHGGITDSGADFRIEAGKIGDCEKIVDAGVYFQVFDIKSACDFLRHVIAQLYVFAAQISRVVHESIACYVVSAVGAVAQYGVSGAVGVFGSPCIVGDIFYQRLPHYGDEAECLVVVIYLMVPRALQQHAEVEIVPFKA